MKSLSLPLYSLNVHMAGMTVTNQVVKFVRLILVGKIVDASDMMNVQLPAQFLLSDTAQLTAISIAFARQSTLALPSLPIVSIIAAAPAWTFLTLKQFGAVGGSTFLATASSFIAAINYKISATLNAVSNLPIIRPTGLKVTLLRTVFCLCAVILSIKPLSAYGTRFFFPLATVHAGRMIAFVPRGTISGTAALHRAIFAIAMISIELSPAYEASQHWHEVFPYWPYLRSCGKAIGLAVQTVHEAVLSHVLLYRNHRKNQMYCAIARERLSVPYTPPMALDAPAPQPAAVQEAL